MFSSVKLEDILLLLTFLPAASTEVVGSAPSQVWSEVGPYTEGTGLFSSRRYTVSCVRRWQLCSTRRQNTQMR